MYENTAAFRLALAIHGQLACRDESHFDCDLPEASWLQCQTLAEGIRRARQRGWRLAASRCEHDLRAMIAILRGELAEIAGRFDSSDRAGRHTATVQDIYHDLLALHDEFEEVSWDRRKQILSVTTEPIELNGIYLGPFQVELDWNELGEGDSDHYRVIAIEPNPAAANESVTHPHVQDEALCEGDGRVPIRSALKQGRLFDFFLIVRNLLETYNSGSPYVELREWYGVTCSDCGSSTSEDDRWTCVKCESTICDGCHYTCAECGDTYCGECIDGCQRCDDRCCPGCLKRCAKCRAWFCDGCLDDKERCDNCHEDEPEEPDENELLAADNADAAGAAFQPYRLGEALVPA